MIVEFGTHATVSIVGNRRFVQRHNPPRHWREVLQDYGNLLASRQSGGSTITRNDDSPSPSTPTSRPRLLSVEEARNVLDNPLLRLPGTSSGRPGGIRLRAAQQVPDSVGRPSLGQYRDFRDKPRSLPQLHPETIMGILRQPDALGDSMLDEEALKRIAKEATRYRRQQGVLGGEAGPESAELYVRVFRALGLDAAGLSRFDAADLQRLYLAYLRVHAG